jgi:hypothetical protein
MTIAPLPNSNKETDIAVLRPAFSLSYLALSARFLPTNVAVIHTLKTIQHNVEVWSPVSLGGPMSLANGDWTAR